MEEFREEFLNIAISRNFCRQLEQHVDVFCAFIPELEDMIGFPQNNPHHAYDVFGHTLHALKQCESEDLIVRLALFFHDFGKPHSYQDGVDGIRHFKGHGRVSAELADTVMERLLFEDGIRSQVRELVYYHDATFQVGRKYIQRWLKKIGPLQFQRLLQIRRADIKGQRPDCEPERIEKVNKIEILLREVLQEPEKPAYEPLAINGNDIKEVMRLDQGREIGFWLKELQRKAADGELQNNREDLLRWLTEQAKGESLCSPPFR